MKILFALVCMILNTHGFASNQLWKNAENVINKRCVVCHGCYDAPCQLKMESYSGLRRGANKLRVYDGDTRLVNANPTRLFIDADTEEEWKKLNFYEVLPESSKDFNSSMFYKLIQLKMKNPLKVNTKLGKNFDVGMNRSQICPSKKEFSGDYDKHWGMPWGTAPLSKKEFDVLSTWLEAGAPGKDNLTPSSYDQKKINMWEDFLNNPNTKYRLTARYIYEHIFLGHLYFPKSPKRRFFKLVRSYSAPGKKILPVKTILPIGDPGKMFYYRFMPIEQTIVDKNHIIYPMGQKKFNRLNKLFIEPNWSTNVGDEFSGDFANPFYTFRDIPAKSRYQFLIDNAHFFVNGFIKGPVCRGQVALDVIRDHFYVSMYDPSSKFALANNSFLYKNYQLLSLPDDSHTAYSQKRWRKYNNSAVLYTEAKEKFFLRADPKNLGPSLDDIWNGDGSNKNAMLTIFRHYDNSTVVKGWQGQYPKTSWVLDYPLFEKIHYLLVADFNVFGNLTHQLYTRMYMDFLRLEGEKNFRSFLPSKQRTANREYWNQGSIAQFKLWLDAPVNGLERSTQVKYPADTKNFEKYFSEQIYEKNKKLAGTDPLNRCDEKCMENTKDPITKSIHDLVALRGERLKFIPPVMFIKVDNKGPVQSSRVYTVVHTDDHTNVLFLFNEAQRRNYKGDYLSIFEGFYGSYPNVFLSLNVKSFKEFNKMLSKVKTEDDWNQILHKFAIRRTNSKYWEYADYFNDKWLALNPLEAGIFDLNRYINF